jgi:hypothetical protein
VHRGTDERGFAYMKSLVKKFSKMGSRNLAGKLQDDEQLVRQVMALFEILSDIYGPDRLVLKAGKLDALSLMRSTELEDRILALERIVFEDPTIDRKPSPNEYESVLADIEEEIADVIARRRVEEKIEKQISDRMQQRHEDYVNEIRLQILNTDAALNTESFVMLPAVSLNLMVPLPASRAGNATASNSITEPRKPATPRPKTFPTSALSEARTCT